MIKYDFYSIRMSKEQALAKAEKIVRAAERLGVPRNFAEDVMWEYDLDLVGIKAAVYSMLRYWRATISQSQKAKDNVYLD